MGYIEDNKKLNAKVEETMRASDGHKRASALDGCFLAIYVPLRERHEARAAPEEARHRL